MKANLVIFLITAMCFYTGYSQSGTKEEAFPKLETSIQKIKVFPNPATNVINVLGLHNSSKADITVSDMYGNTILQHRWEIKNNALNIPVANLTTGIYMITIRSEEQQVQAKFYKK